MDSPLSFNSSENFRKRLLTRNLKPYRVDGSFNFGDVAQIKEFQIVDYAVKDSVEVSTIGNVQEKELYKQNKYGPESSSSTYGDTIEINVNFNVESNYGLYGFKNSIGSHLEKIGDGQEKLLYVNNVYGPSEFSTSYGDTVEINKNLQQDANKGKYGYPLTINSELEQIGNTKEKELIVTNLYKPLNRTDKGYGDTVWYINNNQTIQSRGLGEYTISDAKRSFLNSIGNEQEILSKVRNVYQKKVLIGGNEQPDYGFPVYNINDLKTITTNGSGEYNATDALNSLLNSIGNQREVVLKILNIYKNTGNDFGLPVYWIQNNQVIQTNGTGLYLNATNAIGSKLETIGNDREIVLKVINKYTPAGSLGQDYGSTKYSINNILTLGSDEGPYLPSSAIGSDLEQYGDEIREDIYPQNQYGPAAGYLNTIFPWNNYQTNSNEQEYDPSDTINSKLETDAESIRLTLFPINQYGPVNGQSQTEVNINNNLQTNSNEGNYGPTDSNNSELEQDGNESRLSLIPLNEYNPQNFPTNTVDINVNLVKLTNEGEYGYLSTKGSELEIVGSIKENQAYISNKYVTGDGNYDPISIEDLIPQSYGNAYANSLTPINFIPSTYKPINILLSDNPAGSNGSLSQDSALAFIGARQLRKEYRYRIASELVSQTLGRINALDSEIDPDSGGVSVKPNLNPFDAAGIITGNIPLLARNYVITSPESLVGRALNFTAKLGGLYSPYSIIPGEYFDYPNKRMLNRLVENPVEVVTSTVMGAIRTITGQKNKKGSKLFLANTSDATRSLLFGQIFYNIYRPDYKNLTLRRPSLFAPKPNFYGGGQSDDLFSTLISPIDAQALDRNGEPSGAPVYSVGEIGKYYEGEKFQNYKFGLNTRSFSDGTTPISGGFTWSSKRGYFKVGELAGPGGLQKFDVGPIFSNKSFESAFKDTESWKIEENNVWRDGSILDITQKLVDSATQNGVRKLEHVGTAINQISKVFNDGYIEMTKGSRVIKYTTKNSIDSNSGALKGFEYCRLFTKDNPYLTYSQLQKTNGNIRKYSYSVLDNTYNLNIAPFNDKNGQPTNIVDGQVKKYMLSLENLAWRTSNKPGFTTEDLPACERGPNGGRIMWFPPYNLDFSEDSQANFDPVEFIGRPEKIYTYKNTERNGSISFEVIVDHPSISNLLVDQEFKDIKPESEITKVLDSFFAGCLKYDLYTLAKRFAFLAPQDIQTAINLVKYPEQATTIVKETPPTTPEKTEEVVTTPPQNTDNADDPKYQEVFLFFENAQPNDNVDTSKTSQNFEYWYNSYIANQSNYSTEPLDKVFKYGDDTKAAVNLANFKLDEYVDTRKSSISEFFTRITQEFQDLKDFLTEVFKVLDSGGEVSFDLLATASSTNKNGNQKLSERRNDAVLKFIDEFKVNNKLLKSFRDSTPRKLIITPKAEGSSSKVKDPNYSEIDCTKPFKSKYDEGTYSVQAMACRRTKISNINIKRADPPPTQTPPSQLESVSAAPDAATPTANPVTPQNQVLNNIKQTPQYKDLAKKIIRRLLTECNYFQMIKESNPFVYDNIRSKFQYFNPAFHSITPEGLNSRLVFLQQCVRPGDTIPTVKLNAGGSYDFDYSDAFNSAFGSPPILVLRIGDFFHTKIVPTRLSLKYESQSGALFDLNPEGIGVQPMVAKVDLSFNMIGGHGLAGPVAELQNALSFNYYANTEMYDERATITEDVTSQYDAEFFEAIRTNPLAKPQQLQQNKIGTTIGKQDSSKYDANLSGFTGVLSYKENMKNFIKLTKDYAQNVFQNLKNINSKLLIGGVIIFTKDRKYQNGYFNNINQPNTNLVKIFGKSEYEEKVDLLFSRAKDDVENEKCPILAGLPTQNFTNISTRKIKRKLKDMIESRQSTYLSVLSDASNNIVNSEVNETKMIDVLDQLNYVCNAFDGYANDKNEIIVFSLTGTTPVDASNPSYANTLDELRGDLQDIAKAISGFTNKLETDRLIPTLDEETWNDNFEFNTFIEPNAVPAENRFFMIFGKEIIDNYNTFVNEVVDVVNNNERKNEWASFLKTNLGINPQDGSELPTGIVAQYKSSKDFVDKRFSNFENNYYNSVFCETCNYTLNPDKERKMNFSQVLFPNQTEVDNMKALNSTVNSTGDDYNLKISFN